MKTIEESKRPSKEEQKAAIESFDALSSTLEQIRSEFPEIEFEDTGERIKIPLNALKLLV